MIHMASRVNSRDLMHLETAEAAEHDAAFVRFAIDKLNLSVEMASQILGELRVFRAPVPGEEL